MRISDYVRLDCVKVPLAANSKKVAIRELVELLIQQRQLDEPETIISRLLEREELVPQGTYQAEFAAFPHCTGIAHCKGTHVVLGKPNTPIDWEHADNLPTPVELIVLVASSGEKDEVLFPLVRMSEILRTDRVRDAIRAAVSATELCNCILREDEEVALVQDLPNRGIRLHATLK